MSLATLLPFGPIEGQKSFLGFQPIRVSEEPVCIYFFRQNPVFTSLYLRSPVHVVPPLEEKFRLQMDSSVHKVLIYTEHHSVCPLVGIGTPPTPLPQASVPSPPEPKGGGAHSPAAKGVGESQFRRLEKKLSTLPTLWFCLTFYFFSHLRLCGASFLKLLGKDLSFSTVSKARFYIIEGIVAQDKYF